MSAVLAALRHTEREQNRERAFMLKLDLRYGRVITGTPMGTMQEAAIDGGIGLVIWKNGEETADEIFVTLAEVLWCEIHWFE